MQRLSNEEWSLGGGLTKYKDMMEWLNRIGIPAQTMFERIHDTHSGLPWNGGKVSQYVDKWSLATTVERILKWNALGIAVDLTLNNTTLSQDAIDNPDEDMLWLFENINNGKNGVTVADERLKDFFRSNYPDFRVTASACFGNTDPEFIDELIADYDVVMVPLWLNKDVETLSARDTSKLVVIVTEECWINCPYHTPKDHYDAYSDIINSGKLYWRLTNEVAESCAALKAGDIVPRAENTKIFEDDLTALRNIGVNKFKIASRTRNMQYLTTFVRDYLGFDFIYAGLQTRKYAEKFATE